VDAKPVGTDSVARTLDAGLVVRGALSSVGQTLRLNLALVDGTSGKTITSDSVQRPRDEVFALEDDAAVRLSTLLQRQLAQDIRAQEPEQHTKNLRAWTLYQQARALSRDAEDDLSARDIEASSRKLRHADSLSSLAAVEDPAWATPIVWRARLAFREIQIAGNRDPSRIPFLLDSGLVLANQALSRSPNDADALEMRGTLRYFQWAYRAQPTSALPQLRAAAEADFRASIAANPRRASAWAALSYVLGTAGRERPAEAAARHAYALDPYGPDAGRNLWRAFSAASGQNDADDARRLCAAFARRFPSNFRSRECRLWLYALKGQKPNVPEMWAAYRAYLDASPNNVQKFSALRGQMLVAFGLARAGFADSARHVVIRARGDSAIDPARLLIYYEAFVRTALGDKDEAFRLLQEYARARPEAFEDDDDPWFEDLWSDPRWQALRAAKP
jgi:serine/threonine-protein kinase